MPKEPSPATDRAYHAHRERQRRRICDAARLLFDEHGIDRTTMAEIVSASGVQPSTLYGYYSSKDEIVWALVREVLEDSALRASEAVTGPGSAFDRISNLLHWTVDELMERPKNVRFMAQFDALYARQWPADRLITLEGQILKEGFQVFSTLVREGIADGSLQPDLDPALTMHAVINAVIGAQRRLASLGGKVELEYGQPVDRLFRETIRILLLGLRAPLPALPTALPQTPLALPEAAWKRNA